MTSPQSVSMSAPGYIFYIASLSEAILSRMDVGWNCEIRAEKNL